MLNKSLLLEVENLNVSYGKHQVIKDLSCTLPENAMIGILGANGSGKSTFLKAIMQLIPASGKVLFWSKELKQVRHKIAYLPQRTSVDWDFPATVLDVVLMGLYKEIGWFGSVQKKHKEKAMLYLEKVKMADFASKHISELSGGQQQRVFLARAFAQEADLFLLDEPLVGVDATTENIIVDLLKELQKNGKSVMMVHHQIEDFKEYFDYLLMLKDGKKVIAGETEAVFSSENIYKVYGFKPILT
ncbi:metal ABC transporter ATP-binding protein [Raineya sp.]|jgi:manganese/zinc/iron transport system ATP- binding protein